MSGINGLNDYSNKYNTNVDYSYLFGGTQNVSTGGTFNLNDYEETEPSRFTVHSIYWANNFY